MAAGESTTADTGSVPTAPPALVKDNDELAEAGNAKDGIGYASKDLALPLLSFLGDNPTPHTTPPRPHSWRRPAPMSPTTIRPLPHPAIPPTAPAAVVVGACAHGLVMARALARAGVSVVILESNPAVPGLASRYARIRMAQDINGPGLISALLDLAGELDGGAPILFLTNDRMVRTVADHMAVVRTAYRVSWADSDRDVARLLDKAGLEHRSHEAGLNYPRTRMLREVDDIPGILADLPFPILVKPATPLSSFKAVVLKSEAELRRLTQVHHASLPFLVQQFIPGGDRSIYFCAFYLDHGRILARFDGHKIRSRPMGHTTIAEGCANEAVFQETARFFDGLAFSGPVSLELKDDGNGALYVIEPTVGRTDFWVGVCIANGVNLPLIEYCQQAGLPLPASQQTNQAVWFHEERDLLGIGWFSLNPTLRWNNRRAEFLFLRQDDPGPSARMLSAQLRDRLVRISQLPVRIARKLFKVLLAGQPSGNANRQWRFARGIYWPAPLHPLLPGQQDQLEATGKRESPFSTLAWFDLLYNKGLERGRELAYVLSLETRNGQQTAWLPLAFREARGKNMLESLSNYYSPLFTPLIPPGGEADLSEAFASLLRFHAPETDEIHLRPMAATDPFLHHARAALARHGFWTDTYFCFGNWYLEVGTRRYEAYFSTLPSEIRKNMGRKLRKLTAEGGVTRVITDPGPELEWGIAAYEDIYRESWKRPEPFPEFIPGLCRLAAREGWLRLGILTVKDIPVAGQIWLVKDKIAYIYKLAYKESHRRLSAGTILTASLMEHVIDTDRVESVDYGIGDDPYKRDWMTHRRDRIGLVAFRKYRLRGILAAATHFGRKAAKRFTGRQRAPVLAKNAYNRLAEEAHTAAGPNGPP